MKKREPTQIRAIEKKDKIIEAGFTLFSKHGYYHVNTQDIAKKANVSTGIIYQYFDNKHDILMAGINKYADHIFFPIYNLNFKKNNFKSELKVLINEHIENHRLSKIAHEEIMSMVHSDEKVKDYYYRKEIELTKNLKKSLIDNDFKDEYLLEKVHIALGMIDNLCHEIIYHKHKEINYNKMIDIVVNNIYDLFK